jgi:anthranilate synthase/aminodeoxychorismate synthase-like glutamine amidotransferase
VRPVIVIDNYDSFVHTLSRYLRESGITTRVVRNDSVAVADLLALEPAGVVISPGPGAPCDAGMSADLITALPSSVALLGVCLGHQCLVEAFGGRTRRARRPLHGSATPIRHDGTGLFAQVPSPFAAGRYHSLIGEPAPYGPLVANAWCDEGEVMAVRHAERDWFGVQFHPESLLTPSGRVLIEAFANRCRAAA